MTTIRDLTIHRGERWTPGRVVLHVAEITPLPARRPRLSLWRPVLYVALLPTIFVTALVAALRLLRWGL